FVAYPISHSSKQSSLRLVPSQEWVQPASGRICVKARTHAFPSEASEVQSSQVVSAVPASPSDVLPSHAPNSPGAFPEAVRRRGSSRYSDAASDADSQSGRPSTRTQVGPEVSKREIGLEVVVAIIALKVPLSPAACASCWQRASAAERSWPGRKKLSLKNASRPSTSGVGRSATRSIPKQYSRDSVV